MREKAEGKGLSNSEHQEALWVFINNRENGKKALKELESKENDASTENCNPAKVIQRMGHQLSMRDARRIDYMLESAAAGLASGRRDAVTRKFARVQARKRRLVGKA